MTVFLTSTSDRTIEFNYRLPNGQVATKTILAYALNNEVDFPSEEIYDSFKRQNAIYFSGDKPILIEGKSTGSKAERIYVDREKTNAKKITASAKAAADHVASATQDSGVKINVDVDAVGADK
jgi:hypothetical protein